MIMLNIKHKYYWEENVIIVPLFEYALHKLEIKRTLISK